MSITFHYIEWENFLSTGNSPNRLILDKSPSTLIIGQVGHGKSTLLDAISFVLFGKPFRNITKPLLVNSINNKNAKVTIEFSVSKKRYKVIRGIKPNIFEILVDGQLLSQSADNRDYQKILETQILQLNYKTFTQVVLLGRALFVPFMQLSAAVRREVIEDILDIKVFSMMNQVLKEKMSATKSTLTGLESDIQLKRSSIESQKAIIDLMANSKKASIQAIQEKIDENNTAIISYKDKVTKISAKIVDLNEQIKNIPYNGTNTLTKKRNDLVADIRRYEAAINNVNKHDICPQCIQAVPSEHKEKISNDAKNKIDVLKDSLQKIDTDIKKENVLLDQIDKIRSNIRVEENLVNVAESNIKILLSQNKKYENEIVKASKDSGDIDLEKQKLKEMAASAMEAVNNKNDLLYQREIESVASGLLKDSGIKTAIIKEYLPVMNKLINKYLHAMDTYIHFELDEEFNEVIKSRHRDDFIYQSFSEGEKQKINMAILFTWRQIAMMKNSVNTNLLIMDEIFDSSLDDNSIELLLGVLSEFKDSNIFVISHKGDILQDKFRSVVRFEKKNDFSVML